jgi:hypothetical protein
MNHTIFASIKKKLNLKFLYKGKSLITISPWIYGKRIDFFETGEESLLGFISSRDFRDVAFIDYFPLSDIHDERIISGKFIEPSLNNYLGQWSEIFISVVDNEN